MEEVLEDLKYIYSCALYSTNPEDEYERVEKYINNLEQQNKEIQDKLDKIKEYIEKNTFIPMEDFTRRFNLPELNAVDILSIIESESSEEEMKALVEMNNMLKHENTKLKQDKQELIGFIKGIRYKPVALYPETQEMAEELGKVKLCIILLEKLGE